jgi:hypothetical protein
MSRGCAALACYRGRLQIIGILSDHLSVAGFVPSLLKLTSRVSRRMFCRKISSFCEHHALTILKA